MKRASPLGLAALFAGSALCHAAPAMPPLAMVRSLQLLQDRIAEGDDAALPMQRKLLAMIDQRFRGADQPELRDPQSIRALLVYAMSGGNPATLDLVLSKGAIDALDRTVGQGVAAYIHGENGSALAALAPVDPLSLHPDLAASVALIKGSLLAINDAAEALKLFDEARLLAPGSLVEEAALRRSLPLAAALGERRRFLHCSDSYVRRFVHSPYATQFADAFVSGIVTLQPKVSPAEVDAVAAQLDAAQRRAIYLRLSRHAAIDGLTELSIAAASKAESEGAVASDGSDVRAELYSGLGALTSDGIGKVSDRLGRIDRERLSPNDRVLLDAARKVAGEVLASPLPSKPESAPEDPSLRVAAAHAADGAPDAPDQTDAMLDTAKKALGEVDKLLHKAGQ